MLDSMAVNASPASPTPILDRLEPVPQPRGTGLMVQVWIGLIVYGMMAFLVVRPPFVTTFFGWFADNVKLIMADPNWAGVRLILTGFAIALVCSAVILIHECGHLVAGLALGYRCNSLRFGRVQIDRGFRISRYRDTGDAILGAAWMVPMDWKNIRWRQAAMTLAGPIANLLSAGAIWYLRSGQSLISGTFVAWSAVLGIRNLLPSGVNTDGTRILMLLFDRRRTRRYLAMYKLEVENERGRGERSINPEDLKDAIGFRDDSADTVSAHMIAYLASLSHQRGPGSFDCLETALRYSGHAPPGQREGLAVLAAFFQMFTRNRPDLARQWLAEAPSKTAFPEMRSAVEKAMVGKVRVEGCFRFSTTT